MTELLATKAQIKRQLQLLADRELRGFESTKIFAAQLTSSSLEDPKTGKALISDREVGGSESLSSSSSRMQAPPPLACRENETFLGIPSVNASLHFYANTQALGEIIQDFASVTASSSFPPLCQATGEGLKNGIVNKKATFRVITFDQQGEKRFAGGDSVSIRVDNPSAKGSAASLSNGAVITSFTDFTPENSARIIIKDLQDGKEHFFVSDAPLTFAYKCALCYLLQELTVLSIPLWQKGMYSSMSISR